LSEKTFHLVLVKKYSKAALRNFVLFSLLSALHTVHKCEVNNGQVLMHPTHQKIIEYNEKFKADICLIENILVRKELFQSNCLLRTQRLFNQVLRLGPSMTV